MAAGEPKVIQQVGEGGRFRIVRLLGRGGMGAVYLARQAALERDVALKVIDVEPGALAEQAVLRFEQEMRATARVEHPNTVRLYDSGVLDGGFYLAMEYLPGLTLRAVIEGGAPLPPGRAARIALQIASALGAAHAAGIVHRDLKPENVMILEHFGAPDFVKVLDFGIARFVDTQGQRMTVTGAVIGTPAYMAPEQALGKEVDGRTDLYALGVILYELSSGRVPFARETALATLMAQVNEAPLPLEIVAPGVPEPLAALVMALLDKSPERRPEGAGAVVAALAAIAGTETREAPGATQAAGGTRELAAGTFGVVAGGTQPLPAVGGLPPIGGTLELPGENRGARDEGLAAGGAREEAPAPGGTGAPRALSSTPAEWPSGSIPADVPTRPDADEIVARLSRPGGGGGGRGGRDRGGGGDSGGDSGDAGEARPAPALQSERRWLRGVWGWARIAALCVAGPLAVTAWIRHQQTADLRGRLDKVTHALHEPPLPADCACELADEGKLLGLGDLRTKPSAALARLGSVSEGCVLRWTLSARAFLAAGDPIAAKGAARRALSICSGAAAAEHLLGEAAMKLGDGEGAVAAWRRAAAVAPAFAAPQVSLALAALDKKDAAGAVTLMSALIARDRYAPNAFLARGRAYLALDDPEAAARDLDEAVLQGPNDRDAWFVLGVARERSSPDQARQAFCRASALGRADAAARCKRSRPRNPESRPTTLD